MRTQWTAKGNRDAGSCSCDRGLHRYLRNFGGGEGLNTPNPPPLVRHWRVGRDAFLGAAVFGVRLSKSHWVTLFAKCCSFQSQ